MYAKQLDYGLLQKRISHALSVALKPRALDIPRTEIDALCREYDYPQQYVRRLLTVVDEQTYRWRPDINESHYITDKCPGLSSGLFRALEKYLLLARNPKRQLPYPHLVWHNNVSWINLRRKFPTIGIQAVVRPPVRQFHNDRKERRFNLTVQPRSICLIFHVGDSPETSSLRSFPGVELQNARLAAEFCEPYFTTIGSRVYDYVMDENIDELVRQVITTGNTSIEDLGDTWSRYSDD